MNSMLSSIHQQQGIDARGRRETLTGTVQNREFEVRAISTRRALCRKCRVREQKYEQKKKRRRKRGKKEKNEKKRREALGIGWWLRSTRWDAGMRERPELRTRLRCVYIQYKRIQYKTIHMRTNMKNEWDKRCGAKGWKCMQSADRRARDSLRLIVPGIFEYEYECAYGYVLVLCTRLCIHKH